MKNWLLTNSILLIILIGEVLPLCGQNLVPNGDFFVHSACPDDFDQLNRSKGWFSPSLSTPDFFSSCSSNSMYSVPENNNGYEPGRINDSYGHIWISSIDNRTHEYLAIELSQPLINGKSYILVFYSSLTDKSPYAMDRLGAALFIERPFYNTWDRVNVIPQVSSKKGVLLNEKNGWMEVVDTIKAKGGERFLMIGQFYPHDSLMIESNNGGSTQDAASYYIDAVSLYEIKVEPTVEIPNVCTPNNDGINDLLTIKTEDAQTVHTTIYNRWGQLVYESHELQPAWDGTCQGQPIADGVYFVVCTATGSGDVQTIEKQTVHLIR